MFNEARPMKRLTVLSTALMLLTIAGTSTVQAQGRGRGRGRGNEEKAAPPPPQVAAAEQQRRIQEEQQRAAAYKQKLDQQVHVVQQQTQRLDQQKRAAQIRAQQQYAAQLQQQQQRLQAQRDYAHDPYVSAPEIYRYTVSGNSRRTNQYGADVLRQAVNTGYQQGYNAGQADRQDRWKSSYQTSPAYLDANYGYTGNYIAQSDYNYYFRQGFRRGYQDAYSNQLQYGTTTNGSPSILSNVLSTILGLVSLR
jgi:hypothetical protein